MKIEFELCRRYHYYPPVMKSADLISEEDVNPEQHRLSWERIGLTLLLGILFTFGIFDHSFWSSNETREGAMIGEMFRTGRWVTPTLNGESYLEKPPLLHWTGVVFCHLFGRVNEGLVRLPAALYGFGAAFIITLWGRRLGREKAGFAAAFMCGTAALYLEYSKIVLTDIALTFMVMMSLHLFWEAYTAPKGRVLKYSLFLIVSALSFYAKGLVGPGFIWVGLTFFLLYEKKWKLLFVLGGLFAVLFAALLAPWVWALWKTGGADCLKTVFWANQFGRFLTFSSQDLPKDPYFVHKEPVYYYLKALPVSLLPWTLLVPPALAYWFRRGHSLDTPLHVFMRFSLIGMLLVLHASSAKASCYALPMFPIIFLMTAIWSEDAVTNKNSRIGNWALVITTGFLVFLSVIIPILYLLLLAIPQTSLQAFFHWLFNLRVIARPDVFEEHFRDIDLIRLAGKESARAGLAMALAALAIFTVSARELWLRYKEGAHARSWLAIPIIMAVILILNGETAIPAYDFQRTYKPFARLLKHERELGYRIALANDEEQYIGAFTYYLQSRLPIIDSPRKLNTFLFSNSVPAAAIVKTKELNTWLDALPEKRVKILKTDHKGYKCDYFRLIVNDTTPQAQPSAAKP